MTGHVIGGRVIVGLVAAGLLAAACGTKSAVLEETVTTTSTTEPPAEDEAVFARIEALVRDAGAVVDGIYQEPEVAEEPDHPDVQELRSFHAPDSPRLDAIMKDVEDLANDGHRYVPRPGRSFTEIVLYQMEIVDPDTVQFGYCEAMSVDIRNANDKLVDPLIQVRFGDGEARRIDGKWLIHEMKPWNEVSLSRVQTRECLLYDLDNLPTRAEREETEDNEDGEKGQKKDGDGDQKKEGGKGKKKG